MIQKAEAVATEVGGVLHLRLNAYIIECIHPGIPGHTEANEKLNVFAHLAALEHREFELEVRPAALAAAVTSVGIRCSTMFHHGSVGLGFDDLFHGLFFLLLRLCLDFNVVGGFNEHGIVVEAKYRLHGLNTEFTVELVVSERLVATIEFLEEDQTRLIDVEAERLLLSANGFNAVDVDVVNTAFNRFAVLIDVSGAAALEEHNVMCVVRIREHHAIAHLAAVRDVCECIVLSREFLAEGKGFLFDLHGLFFLLMSFIFHKSISPLIVYS